MLSHKLAEGGSIGTHMLRMTSDVEQLEKLNAPLSKEFATDVVLQSLSPSFSNFIMNYHVLGMEKSLQELQWMLRIAKYDMKKSSSILVIRAGEKNVKPPKKWQLSTRAKGKRLLNLILPR